MNRKNNKKGFTIVELVIVIAVIGILAAVLIPTFSGVISSANESARDQEARNALTEYMLNASNDELDDINGYIVIDGHYYKVEKNNLVDVETENPTEVDDANVIYCNSCGDTCSHDTASKE